MSVTIIQIESAVMTADVLQVRYDGDAPSHNHLIEIEIQNGDTRAVSIWVHPYDLSKALSAMSQARETAVHRAASITKPNERNEK